MGSLLQREIQQRRPFHSRSQEAVLGLLKTADGIGRSLNAVLAPYGITRQQYNVLRILRGAGEPLPTLSIAERMVEQTPGITRLLDRLEAKGLAGRERCAEDRRQVLCSISPQGLDLLKRLDEPMAKADARPMAELSDRDLSKLIRILDRVRASCAAVEAAT